MSSCVSQTTTRRPQPHLEPHDRLYMFFVSAAIVWSGVLLCNARGLDVHALIIANSASVSASIVWDALLPL
jgi:hypothetical protein